MKLQPAKEENMKTATIICLLALSLTGCAGEFFPISDETIQAGANYTKDASVAKEEAVHKTLRHRDKMIKESNEKPSFKLGWQSVEETVFYPGMSQPITLKKAMPTVEYTEKKDFNQPLPIAPSVHPLWAMLTSVGNNAIDKTFFGFLGSGFFGSLNKATENAGTHYNGPYSPVTDSYNATAEPFFSPVEVPAP